jgi:hypothetical protein
MRLTPEHHDARLRGHVEAGQRTLAWLAREHRIALGAMEVTARGAIVEVDAATWERVLAVTENQPRRRGGRVEVDLFGIIVRRAR